MPEAQPLSAYVAFLRLRYVRPNTIKTYSKHLRPYLQFAAQQPPGAALDETIRAFLAQLKCKSDRTRASYWRSISAFHAWRGDKLQIRPRFKPARKVPPPPQREVVRRLRLLPRSTWVQRRDRTCLILVYLTGARLGEIAELKWETIGDTSMGIFQSKVDQWRECPVTPTIRAVLDAWRPESDYEYVFPALAKGYREKRTVSQAMNYVNAQRLWREHQNALDLEGPRMSVHALRKAYASHAHAHGAMSELEIQSQLGHSTDVMTKWYIQPDNSTIYKKLNRWHEQLELF